MKRKIETVALSVQLILAGGFLVLLILADFGVIFPSDNTFARVMQHLTAILLVLSSLIQLSNRKKK